MKRIPIVPRTDWEQKIKEQGFLFYNDDCYYYESAVYEFTYEEIDMIEKATAEIYAMCLAVTEYVIHHKLWDEFCIPREYGSLIEWSWQQKQPSFYGRFDLAYNEGQIKLLEFNADTPTLLLETAVIQWFWLQDYNKELDQYNRVHEAMVSHIRDTVPQLQPGKLYFSAPDNMEDFMTVKYMQDAAAQAGLETEFLYIDDVMLNNEDRFTDKDGKLITNIFKLYPYEWLFDEPFGKYLLQNKEECCWIEPAFKAILSNKMMLKYLYQLFPDSPYILPCTLSLEEATDSLAGYARKPIYSREGENVRLVLNGQTLEETGGEYGDEGYVYQQYFELPEFDGKHPIIGSWLIGGRPVGMGIRESTGRITNVTSSFCSHYIANDGY